MESEITKKKLEELLNDPELSEWFKSALKSVLERDPFEASVDTELLFNAIKARELCLGKKILTEF